jgi:DNA-binding Lrp family transcriptional regulator
MERSLTTGETNYLLRGMVPDVASLERLIVDFLAKVPGVSKI